MTGTVWKLAFAIVGLAGASAAHAAEATELAVLSHASTVPTVSQNTGSLAPTTVIAAGQRETNLQKSATFIAVSGIDSIRPRRNPR